MKRPMIAGMALLAVTVLAAAGGKYKTPMEDCLQSVEDLKAAYAEKDVGEKVAAEVEKLIEISSHLCNQANFVYAKELAQLGRTMLATE